MTCHTRLAYCPCQTKGRQQFMDSWQYQAAFVIQFRPETNIEAGRFEGRVEHIPSSRSTRFHTLEELLAFIANTLSEMSITDEAQS